MKTTPAGRLADQLRIRSRRILRGVITVGIGVALLVGLPGNTGIGSLLASLLNGAVFALLFLPVYAIPGALVGVLMPDFSRWNPLPLVLAAALAVGAAFGLALEFAAPPHRNPLPKLVDTPALVAQGDPGEPSRLRQVRHWVSTNWSACFFGAWFAGWVLHERRRPRVPLPTPGIPEGGH